MVVDAVVNEPGSGPAARWRTEIDRLAANQRLRTICYAVAGVLIFYWLIQALWPAPIGVLIQGVIVGSLTAMVAFGISLVYRANRIINFAAADLGGVPATLAVLLMVFEGVPYIPAVLAGLVAAVILGAVVEIGIIRWFAKAPRLNLTAATIGLAQVLAFAEITLPRAFHGQTPPQNFPAPFQLTFSIRGYRFDANSVVAMVVVPLVLLGLWAFFRYTDTGVAIRASAERSDRASLLGVPVRRLNTLVWIAATVLATIGLLLRAGIVGLPFGSALGLSVLVQALTATAIARMERLWLMFVVAVGIGVVEQAVIWNTRSALMLDPVLFGVILVALLAQRRQALSRLVDAAVSSWRDVTEVRRIPRELRHLPEVRGVVLATYAVLLTVALIAPPIIGEGRTDLAAGLLIYGIVAASLVVLTGWSGQISLGHFAFVGLGAAVGGWVTLHLQWDILLALLISGLAGAVASVIIGVPALRIRGLFLAVTTLAFAQAAYSYFLNSNYISAVPSGDRYIPRLPLLSHIDISTETRYYYFCLAIFVLTIGSVARLRRTRTGRLLIAVRENERAVQSFGLNLTASKLAAFAISGFLAAMAGGLFVHLQTGFLNTSFQPEQSLTVFVMVVIGGLGSITGAVIGAAYILSLSWLRPLFPTAIADFMTFLGAGAGLIIVLMFLPGGLGSLVFRVRDIWLRRVANRRGIVVPSLIADLRIPEPYPEAAAAAKVATAGEASG